MNENEGEPTRILARHNASCRVHTVSDYELPRDNEYSNSQGYQSTTLTLSTQKKIRKPNFKNSKIFWENRLQNTQAMNTYVSHSSQSAAEWGWCSRRSGSGRGSEAEHTAAGDRSNGLATAERKRSRLDGPKRFEEDVEDDLQVTTQRTQFCFLKGGSNGGNAERETNE